MLSLSFGHRVVAGALGTRFTNSVIELLREPELLLIERWDTHQELKGGGTRDAMKIEVNSS